MGGKSRAGATVPTHSKAWVRQLIFIFVAVLINTYRRALIYMQPLMLYRQSIEVDDVLLRELVDTRLQEDDTQDIVTVSSSTVTRLPLADGV